MKRALEDLYIVLALATLTYFALGIEKPTDLFYSPFKIGNMDCSYPTNVTCTILSHNDMVFPIYFNYSTSRKINN